MSRPYTFDSLLTQVWQRAISSLRNNLREERLPTLISTWVVSVLLKAKLSPKEPEIRDYLALLDNWVEQLEAKAEVLDESSTGLLGLWIYLRRQRRKRIKNHLENLFLRSVEHNLQKPKDLSLSTSVDLLTAVAAGLGDTSPSAELQPRMSKRLQALMQNADALELVQLLQSWELIQRAGDIPHMDMQHRLESIAAKEDSRIVERAMAYYGLMRLAELFDAPSIEYEMRFLDCLGTASSNQDESDSMIKAYVLSLPYLKRKMSYDSLFDTWQKYTDSAFKRAKTGYYWTRYLFVVSLAALASIVFWPWFQQLAPGFQVSIGMEAGTALLMLTVYTIQVTLELRGRLFWEKGRIEILILLIGSLIAIGAALVEALLK